jgi:hypothetical protein
MTLRRGFSLKPGEKVFGRRRRDHDRRFNAECIAALEENGGKVLAAASIIDRSNGTADVGVPASRLPRSMFQATRLPAARCVPRAAEPYKPGKQEMSGRVEEFWAEFLRVEPAVQPETPYQVWYFGNTSEMARELAELVLHGKKTATASLLETNKRQPQNAPMEKGSASSRIRKPHRFA